jgi:UDP-N-acetylmuramoyl-tripeptide--D-alanyl-D-alanine ligase
VRLLANAHLARGARRWFIFGDMLELGKYSPDEHAVVGRVAAGAIDELVLVGTEVQATAEAALKAGMRQEQIHLYPASLLQPSELVCARLAAAAFVREKVRHGDIVLIKGSLGVGMDAIVNELQEKKSGHHLQSDITTRLQQLTQVEATLTAGSRSKAE